MSSKIIHVLCEGQTEQGFVETVLKPYLLDKGIDAVKSVLVTTNKKLNARGGILKYEYAIRDLELLKKTFVDGQYERHIFTTMFDLYALPTDFPGYKEAITKMDKYERVKTLEEAFAKDCDDARFIPYIQLHEFEALVFCGLSFLKDLYPKCKVGYRELENTLLCQPNPELINTNPDKAPSKRIIKAIETDSKSLYRYNKPRTGKYVTEKVGIEELRSKCKHFSDWIDNLIDK